MIENVHFVKILKFVMVAMETGHYMRLYAIAAWLTCFFAESRDAKLRSDKRHIMLYFRDQLLPEYAS